jgi:hypothetical protein
MEVTDSDKQSSGLYYKPMTIINDDSRVITKLETSHTDHARGVIYNCHMFIVEAAAYYFTDFNTCVKCFSVRTRGAFAATHFHPSLIFAVKSGSQEWRPVPYFIEYSAHFLTWKMMLKYSLHTIHGR